MTGMLPLRTIEATRYVTPLREGGGMPAIVEADDCGLYVLKFRGAGQGPLALVAELIGGEVGRALGLPVPELVFVNLDAALGRNEPDQEIQDLIAASTGLNIALDYLPGSFMFNVAAGNRLDPELASRVVWLDAFITNVDRTVRNPNLLLWHRKPYLIDHGAALYFHHNWPATEEALMAAARSPFRAIGNHLLISQAAAIADISIAAQRLVTAELIDEVLQQLPFEWLGSSATRDGYRRYLIQRLEAHQEWEAEAQQAYAAAQPV